MIKIDNVSYSYPSSGKNVIDGFSLNINKGCICGLLGENGVGKTTLLGLVCGLLRPTVGSVTIDGDEVFRRNPDTLAKVILVPDEFALPHLSLKRFVQANKAFYPTFSQELLDFCLATFGLSADSKPLDQLSLGQRKKVMLSFAVASGAEVVLMDEPTNGLDIPSKSLFRKIVAKAMDENRLLLISTHQVHDVEQILDQIVIMDNNRILLNDSVADIANRFAFEYVPQSSISPDALYFEPTPAGVAVVRPKTEYDDETQINLELLFNAAIRGKLIN